MTFMNLILYTVDVVDFHKISKEELKSNIINEGIVIFQGDSKL